jgi:hypothetical protein
MRHWIVSAVLVLASLVQISAAQAAGDLTPRMVQETLRRVSAQTHTRFPFLEQVLNQVPVKRATSEFLQQNGSTVGIYFRRTLFLHESMFDAGGFNPDGIAFGLLLHEAWHAYFDLIMPQPQKRNLENQWQSHYRRAGHSSSQAYVIGDEAIGSYAQLLASYYGFAVKRFTRDRALNERFLGDYRKAFNGADAYGYDDDGTQANVPASPAERAALLAITGGAFPTTENLIQTLEQRIPAPTPSPAPTEPVLEPAPVPSEVPAA